MPPPAAGQAIIVDHTTTDLSRIPPRWLEQAKRTVIRAYGSTSHGTQLWTGADYLSEYPYFALHKGSCIIGSVAQLYIKREDSIATQMERAGTFVPALSAWCSVASASP